MQNTVSLGLTCLRFGATPEIAPLLIPCLPVQTSKNVLGMSYLPSASLQTSMDTAPHQQSHQSRSAFFPVSGKVDVPLSERCSDAVSHSQRQHRASSAEQQYKLQSKVSRGPAVEHRATYGQSSSAVRAWRFPSSRRFLWDRTATGPCIHLHPQVPESMHLTQPPHFTSLPEYQ